MIRTLSAGSFRGFFGFVAFRFPHLHHHLKYQTVVFISSVIGRRSVALLPQRLVAEHRVLAALASVLRLGTMSAASRAREC
jgi:hypothetical protein